jgi:hypothetical protein
LTVFHGDLPLKSAAPARAGIIWRGGGRVQQARRRRPD